VSPLNPLSVSPWKATGQNGYQEHPVVFGCVDYYTAQCGYSGKASTRRQQDRHRCWV
jgi:hypothetical protein